MNKSFLLTAMIAAAGIFSGEAAFAQTGVSLEAEIQSYERTAARSDISAQERHGALIRLANLRQVSGDIEGAARNWLEAAAAIPGDVDDNALLSCAYCLAVMGEWERAGTALDPLLSKSPRARFLNTAIKAISSGDISALSAMAEGPEYNELKSEIYFFLWRISRSIYSEGTVSERWRLRLIAEFPQSPEGRLAAGLSAAAYGASSIIVSPSPFWLLINSIESSPSAASFPVSETSQKTAASSAINAAQTDSVKLQTGLFSRQANAQTQIAGLRQAGFSPFMEQRYANNGEMWAVVVPAGSDVNRTISDLREAGFESFPVR
ncbi:MAG: SPOR domain-containing protein [Treponema sp.]|nr:SPOR domain-containing protein [Treponema sp.]